MIPYGHQSISKKDIDAVDDVLAGDWLTQGPAVKLFENKLCQYTGAKYAIAVANGTAGLHLAYIAAGIKGGDEVITTPNTFVATTNMLLAVGAKPVFCDIRSDNYNIDEDKIEALINKKTKAIVPVHFAGYPCAMDKILSIARKYNLMVIEDSCHALGAQYKNKKIGNISGLSIFSFHPVKSITTGEGGAVLTNNKDIYERMIFLRSHGITKDKDSFNVMKTFGYNYRITDIQCALGASQLDRLDQFVARRRELATIYNKALKQNMHIILPVSDGTGVMSAHHLYVIRVKDQNYRMPLYNYMKENGVGVNFHYPTVYSHPYYRENGYVGIKNSVADLYARTAITIPLHCLLTKKQVLQISELINNFFES